MELGVQEMGIKEVGYRYQGWKDGNPERHGIIDGIQNRGSPMFGCSETCGSRGKGLQVGCREMGFRYGLYRETGV